MEGTQVMNDVRLYEISNDIVSNIVDLRFVVKVHKGLFNKPDFLNPAKHKKTFERAVAKVRKSFVDKHVTIKPYFTSWASAACTHVNVYIMVIPNDGTIMYTKKEY